MKRSTDNVAVRALAAGLLYGLTCGQSLYAAETSGQDALGVGDIVVTAQKREQSANRVPMSITALTGAQLKSSGVNSTEDLSKIVSGFSTVKSFYGSPVYYLRGVGYYDNSVAARPTVTIYTDEAPLPYSVMAMGTTLDLERVEVLKGPQGTLFGSNSTGGAINFVAGKPGSTLEAGVDASYGRFNELLVSGFVSGPLSDSVAVRLAASHERSDDWQRNFIDGDTLGSKNITSFRGTMRLSPDGPLTALLTVSGTFDKSDTQGAQLVGKNTLAPSTPQFDAFPLTPQNARATAFSRDTPYDAGLGKDNRQLQATARITYDMSDQATVTSLTSVASNRQHYGVNLSGTTLQVDSARRTGRIRSFSQELRINGTVADGSGRYILGANYEDNSTREDTAFNNIDLGAGQVFSFLGLPPIDLIPTKLKTKYESTGVFGNFEYDVGQDLTIHAGARYADTKLRYQGCSEVAGNQSYGIGIRTVLNATTPSNIPLIPLGGCANFTPAPGGGFELTTIKGDVGQDSLSWRVGLDWKPVPGTLIYGNISRGFKAQAVSNIAAVFDAQYVPVVQERLTAYEIGAKTNLLPNTQLNAALFYYQYADKQLQGTLVVPIFGPLQALVSIPKSHILGGEVDLVTRPLRGLTLGMQATYTHSEVDGSFVGANQLGEDRDFDGSPFPNVPKWQVSANAEYRFAVSAGLEAYIGGRYSYRSAAYGDFLKDSRFKIKSYGLLDAQVGVAGEEGKWSVEIYGRNLTDKYYWTAQNAYLEAIVRYAGMPATYGVRTTVRF